MYGRKLRLRRFYSLLISSSILKTWEKWISLGLYQQATFDTGHWYQITTCGAEIVIQRL